MAEQEHDHNQEQDDERAKIEKQRQRQRQKQKRVLSRLRQILSWQERLTLFKRLLLGFGLVLMFSVVIALVTLSQILSLSAAFEHSERIGTQHQLVLKIDAAVKDRVSRSLNDLWTGRTSFGSSAGSSGSGVTSTATNIQNPPASTPDSLTQLFNKLRDADANANADADADANANADRGAAAPGLGVIAIKSLEEQTTSLLSFVQKTISLERSGNIFEARSGWIKGSVLFIDFNENLERLIKTFETEVAKARSQYNTALVVALVVISVCTVLALLMAIALAYFVTRSVVKRIHQVRRAMQMVAESNHFEVSPIEISGNDEITDMTRAFNRMVAKLHTSLVALQETGLTVETSSQRFAQMMQRQLLTAEEQVSAVNSIVSATSQLEHTSKEIDSQIEVVAQKVKENSLSVSSLATAIIQASEQVGKTHEATQETTRGINQMINDTSLMSQEVAELLDQLSAVEKLAGDLRAVAGEIHLLALNAAIESASAGIYGERFRVVAGSVKTLSVQSQQVVQNMTYFVQGVGNKARNVTAALNRTNEGLAKSQNLIGIIEDIGQESRGLSSQMSEPVQKISGLVTQMAEQSQHIALATRAQRSATEDIVNTVLGVDIIAKETMRYYGENIQAVTNLRTEVERLNSLVNNRSFVG
jgi:methyl-accepting chemotaxis protein